MEICDFSTKGFCECAQTINFTKTEYFKCSDVVKFGNKRNAYFKCFKDFTKEKMGVYVFYVDNKEILYVGKSGGNSNKSDWSLYDRLKQHFQEGHDGGLFKRLLGEYNNKNKVIETFRNKIHLKMLVFESVDVVNRIEHFLISTLNPKYNDKS